MQARLEVKGIGDISEVLKKFSRMFRNPKVMQKWSRAIWDKAGDKLVRQAQDRWTPTTGASRSGIRRHPEMVGTDANSLLVYGIMDSKMAGTPSYHVGGSALAQETGRKAGKIPNVTDVSEWVKFKGIPLFTDTDPNRALMRTAAWVAKRISLKNYPGKNRLLKTSSTRGNFDGYVDISEFYDDDVNVINASFNYFGDKLLEELEKR